MTIEVGEQEDEQEGSEEGKKSDEPGLECTVYSANVCTLSAIIL